MVPVLQAFLDAHRLSDVIVIADAGMVSDANKRAIEQAGLSFILGARVPDVPYVVTEWRRSIIAAKRASLHPTEDSRTATLLAFTSSCPCPEILLFVPRG